MKLDRLMGILTVLLQNEKITAPELARRFEVSRRTILRDVEALSMAGIPVLSTRGSDGGISIMEGYRLNNKDAFTAQEQLINLYGYHEDSLSEKIELLKRAIAQRRAVRFDYYYAKGEMIREIEPYFVQFTWNAWYVFGWCRLREDFRRFKLNRLWSLTLTDSAFELRSIPEEQASARDAFPEQHHIKILFDKSARYRLIEDYGLHCYEETGDGLLLSLDYTNKDYIFLWILGFGDKAEILAPEKVREEFAAIARNISARYDGM